MNMRLMQNEYKIKLQNCEITLIVCLNYNYYTITITNGNKLA